MSMQTSHVELVGKHEVQYAIVTLSRDKEFLKLMEYELPELVESLELRFAPQTIFLKQSLNKSLDKYYLLVEIQIGSKTINFNVLVNDSGPAFIIETPKQLYPLLSAKRIRETLYDLAVEFFDIRYA